MADLFEKFFDDIDGEGHIDVSYNSSDPDNNNVFVHVIDTFTKRDAYVVVSPSTARALRDHLNFLLGPRGTD